MPVQVDARDNAGGRTPLLLAARGLHEESVRVLLQHGANPDIRVCTQSRETSKLTINSSLQCVYLNEIFVC